MALAGAGQGIQSLRPGVGPLGSALTGFSRGFILSNASKRAAEDYALKQQEAEAEREFREYRKQDIISQIEARAKEKTPPVMDWQRPPEEQAAIIDFETRRAKSLAEAKPKEPGKPDRTEILDFNTVIDNFRQEPNVKDFIVVRDNARRIQGALDQGTGFGDLSAIFAFMRVLDPNSVVRETEFKNAEEASGWLQRTLNLPGKAVSGNRLTPMARAKIGIMVRNLYAVQKQTYDRKVEQYKKIAKKFNVDESLLIPDYGDQGVQGGAADPLGIR
jgi:hypothetical protein